MVSRQRRHATAAAVVTGAQAKWLMPGVMSRGDLGGALSVVGRSAPACVPQSAAGMCFQLTMSPVADASRLSLSCPPRTLAHAAASSSRPAAGAWQGNAPQSYGHANRVRYMPLAAINAAPGMTNTAAVAPDGDGQPADGPFNSLRLWLQQQFLKLPMLRPLVAPLARAVLEDDIATEADELQERMMVPERGHAVMPVIDLKRQKKLKPPGKLSREDRALWELFREIDVNGDGHIDFNEMQYVLSKLTLPMYPRTLVSAMRKFEGSDGTDKVTWEQFRQYVSERDSSIRTAFRSFDTNSSGQIKAGELAQAMTIANLPSTGRDIQKVLEAMGKNSTDNLSYSEFRNFVCLMPGWKFHGGAYASFKNYAEWLRSGEATRHRPERMYTTASAPLQHYVVFDLFLRGSIAASLFVALLMAANTD